MKYIISFILSLVCFTNVMAGGYFINIISEDKWENGNTHKVGGSVMMYSCKDKWSFTLDATKISNDSTQYFLGIIVGSNYSEDFERGSYFLIKTCDGAIIKIKSTYAKSDISTYTDDIYINAIEGRISPSDMEHIKSGILKIRIECDNSYGKLDKDYCSYNKFLPNCTAQLGKSLYKVYQGINQRMLVTKKPSLEDGF